MGTVLRAYMSAADVGDRDGAVVLLADIREQFARLRHVFADQAYRGQAFTDWIHQKTAITIEIVQRRDGTSSNRLSNSSPSRANHHRWFERSGIQPHRLHPGSVCGL
jgi:transposase